MAESIAIQDHPETAQSRRFSGDMMRLQNLIDELSKRADDSELVSRLATNQHTRVYNAELARELRDVVGTLKTEIDHRQPSALHEQN
jgi:hypothetical protein